MHVHANKYEVLLVHYCCCKQAAVPFLALTRPKAACVGCPEQHCSAAFAKCTQPQSRPLETPPRVSNADLVVQCLQARCLSMVGMPSTLSAESATFDVASLLGADSPMSIGGTAWSSSADSFTSGVASLSDAGSPMSSSSVATHDSDVFEGEMEVSGDAAPAGACQATPCPCIK